MLNKELLDEVVSLDDSQSGTQRIVISPLKKGEGAALAQLLKQFLAHSVAGCAISGVRFEGISHAFAVIPRVKEDVHKIISNLKKIVVRVNGNFDTRDQKIIVLRSNKVGTVTAGDFDLPEDIEILNPTQEICHLSEDGAFHMECLITKGRSYVSDVQMKTGEYADSMLMFGVDYAPVKNVAYEVNEVSAGKNANLEELNLIVTTDGSLQALDAVKQAAKRLTDIIGGFLQNSVEQIEYVEEATTKAPFDLVLLEKVDSLQLSPRAQSCMKHYDVVRLGDLVMKTDKDLLSVPHVGQVSVDEIKTALANKGLSLGMVISGWTPENIEKFTLDS